MRSRCAINTRCQLDVCASKVQGASTPARPQGLLRMLHKRPRIAAELRRPQGERRRGRAGLLDLAALLEWLWGQMAVPERRARVWVQWLHARLARLDLAAAQAEAEAQVLSTSLPGHMRPRARDHGMQCRGGGYKGSAQCL